MTVTLRMPATLRRVERCSSHQSVSARDETRSDLMCFEDLGRCGVWGRVQFHTARMAGTACAVNWVEVCSSTIALRLGSAIADSRKLHDHFFNKTAMRKEGARDLLSGRLRREEYRCRSPRLQSPSMRWRGGAPLTRPAAAPIVSLTP